MKGRRAPRGRRFYLSLAFAAIVAPLAAAGGLFAVSGHLWTEIHKRCALVPHYDPGRFLLGRLENVELRDPTVLQFGPDGRLYVADRWGWIHLLRIERGGPAAYRVTNRESLGLIRDLPNHDDDGAVRPDLHDRLITGMLVTGSAAAPEIYVSSSDGRIGSPAIDSNSGVISRLRAKDGSWSREDLLRGLPRSKYDHAANGLALDAAGGVLYIAQGGHTNAGAPSMDFHYQPETALSAAILALDLHALGGAPYDLPTLDDEDRPGSPDANDPFGGNGGKNQAVLPADGPLTIFASGFRNPYDLLLLDTGLYTVDNGANPGWGGRPARDSKSGKPAHEPVEGGRYSANTFHHIRGPGYYGGFPNPTRANIALRFNLTRPQRAIREESPREAHWIDPGQQEGALHVFGYSTNGLAVYRSRALGEEMSGAVLAVDLKSSLHWLRLDAGGGRVTDSGVLLSNWSPMPLDVAAQPEGEIFAGTIWTADHGSGRIHVIEPRGASPLTWSGQRAVFAAWLRGAACACLKWAAGEYVSRGLRKSWLRWRDRWNR